MIHTFRSFVWWYDLILGILYQNFSRFDRAPTRSQKIPQTYIPLSFAYTRAILSSSSAARTIIQLICKILRSVLACTVQIIFIQSSNHVDGLSAGCVIKIFFSRYIKIKPYGPVEVIQWRTDKLQW